jgi:cell division protein FtsQ
MTAVDNSFQPLIQVARVLTWGALALLAYGVSAWTVAQPWFALRSIEVATPVKHVTETQVRLVAERHVRGTFFTVGLDRVREGLEKLPWVREARVERHWPDTLVVSITEHVPLARWNQDALVNQHGEVFAAASNQDLPRFSGPEDSSVEVTQAWQRFQTQLAPLGHSVSELHLSSRRAWQLRLDNGTHIVLGRSEPEKRLARFTAVYPRLFSAPASEPAYVDLRYVDGFAIRMPGGANPFEPSKS